MTDFAALLRDHSSPLDAQPTGLAPHLERLDGIKAVLFDVYGTLVISGSGDVGTHAAEDRGDAFRDALRTVDAHAAPDGAAGVAALQQAVALHHAAARQAGAEYPEVDIREVWADALTLLRAPVPDEETLGRLSLEYERRVNPTWSMPHAAEILRELKRRGLLLGIVSNAQWFTPHLFPAHLGDTLEGFGFDPNVQSWSWEHRRAKPGTFLYEHAAERLTPHGITPREALYVGNDLLNDCTPAGAVGFRTALFAGDARSLRLREGDERVADTRPTVTLTDLRQLLECLPAVRAPMENSADHG